ncbi:MAG: hypothetical protein A2147_03375 [Chloroflexi bacterium RBG_16_57_8]|nr:MAG: hypothetical protein A2147_03375 [Chloroflexi bacterium RBG_16_57_8]
MSGKLEGKSAVVTGAGAGGIGEAVCMLMAKEGAKVVVNDFKPQIADETVEKVKKEGGTAVANSDSVATMAGGQAIINAAVKNFGKIDILINIAGNYIVGNILEQTEADWDSQINVHLKGAFSCTQAAAKEMVKQKNGRVINISSPTPFAYKGMGSRSIAYSAAKSGIIGFTITASRQLEEYGITVNGIIPGAVTKLFPGPPGPPRPAGTAPAPPAAAPRPSGLLVGMASPDFVAPTIVYLCTDEAKDITGRFFHAAGNRVGVYARPFDLNTSNSSVYKLGQWTVDEVKEVIPRML